MMQDAVRVALGVVRSVVSEALAVLDKLGWVTRGPRRREGRSVTLSHEGFEVLKYAWNAQIELEAQILESFDDDAVAERFERACADVCVNVGGAQPILLYDNIEYFD
jgi:hypothetical protein